MRHLVEEVVALLLQKTRLGWGIDLQQNCFSPVDNGLFAPWDNIWFFEEIVRNQLYVHIYAKYRPGSFHCSSLFALRRRKKEWNFVTGSEDVIYSFVGNTLSIILQSHFFCFIFYFSARYECDKDRLYSLRS